MKIMLVCLSHPCSFVLFFQVLGKHKCNGNIGVIPFVFGLLGIAPEREHKGSPLKTLQLPTTTDFPRLCNFTTSQDVTASFLFPDGLGSGALWRSWSQRSARHDLGNSSGPSSSVSAVWQRQTPWAATAKLKIWMISHAGVCRTHSESLMPFGDSSKSLFRFSHWWSMDDELMVQER